MLNYFGVCFKENGHAPFFYAHRMEDNLSPAVGLNIILICTKGVITHAEKIEFSGNFGY